MKIVMMLTLAAGPDGVLEAGKVYEVCDLRAEQMIAGGYAVEVVAPKKAPLEVTPEAAPEVTPGAATEAAPEARRRKSVRG